MTQPLSANERRQMQDGANPCRVLRLSRLSSMTLTEIGEQLGREKSYVSRLEKNEFVGSFAIWRELCSLFNASLDEIAPYVREDRRDRSKSGKGKAASSSRRQPVRERIQTH